MAIHASQTLKPGMRERLIGGAGRRWHVHVEGTERERNSGPVCIFRIHACCCCCYPEGRRLRIDESDVDVRGMQRELAEENRNGAAFGPSATCTTCPSVSFSASSPTSVLYCFSPCFKPVSLTRLLVLLDLLRPTTSDS